MSVSWSSKCILPINFMIFVRRAVHEYHQHNMQYGGGLLLPAHQYKDATASWHPQHRLHDPATAHHLDSAAAAAAAAYSAYPSIS
ncbi:unnamed protein product, partial [Nesidiocoris tenuis]